MWEPEIHRVRASLQLRGGDVDGADFSLWRALAKARSQEALMRELRAAHDPYEMLAESGRRDEGAALVEEAASARDRASDQPEVARLHVLALVAK
jgi:hypothetical protein